MTQLQSLNAALRERRLVKVIAGIENFDRDRVVAIARAAEAGGAQAVDIAADAGLIAAVKAETNLIVFVSSIKPKKLIEAAKAGADVLELGNFDAMYLRDLQPTRDEILGWAREVKAAVGNSVPLCVTVCGRLPLAEQLDLARALQAMGVEILQTEGEVGPAGRDTASALSAAIAALANTAEIRQAVELPLLLAGGLNVISAPFAFAAGADALGVGAAITQHADEKAMSEATRAIVASLETVRAAGKGLSRA